MSTPDEIVEARFVPLQAGRRDELHPVAARCFVRRPVLPSQMVTFGWRVMKSWLCGFARAPLIGLVNQHAIGEIELEVLLVEVEAVAL